MAHEKKLRQSYEELMNSVAGLSNVVNQLQKDVLGIRQVFANNAKVLAAIVSLLGEESVQGEMDRMVQEQQAAQDAQLEAGIKELVNANVLKPVAETALGTLVVGSDTDASGHTRRVQFEIKEGVVPSDVLPKFLAKKPGEVIENNGVKMTIVEVYEIDRAKAAEFHADLAKKAERERAAAQQPGETAEMYETRKALVAAVTAHMRDDTSEPLSEPIKQYVSERTAESLPGETQEQAEERVTAEINAHTQAVLANESAGEPFSEPKPE